MGTSLLGTGAGYHYGGYENFSKANLGCETFCNIFEHCGIKSYTYFSMGYEKFSKENLGCETFCNIFEHCGIKSYTYFSMGYEKFSRKI